MDWAYNELFMSGIHVENTFSQRQGEDEEYAIACLQTNT